MTLVAVNQCFCKDVTVPVGNMHAGTGSVKEEWFLVIFISISVRTFMSLIWRYSSMMAVDFLPSSSSVKAGLVGVWGGGGVAVFSRFTVHTQNGKEIKIQFYQSEFILTYAKKNKISKSTNTILTVFIRIEHNNSYNCRISSVVSLVCSFLDSLVLLCHFV